jgi:hypothetical protein
MLDTQFGEITPCLSILHCSLFLFHTFLGLSCHHEHVVSIHHILPRVLNCRDIDCPFSRFNPSLKFVWKHVSRDNDAWSMDLWVWHGMLFSKEPISMNPSFLFLQPFLWLQKKPGPESLLRWCWKLPPLPGWFFTTYIMSYSTNHQEIIVTNSGYIYI